MDGLTVERIGQTTELRDAGFALVRPGGPDDVAAVGATSTTGDVPRLLVLARAYGPGPAPTVSVAAVGSAPAVVVTWRPTTSGVGAGGTPVVAGVWAVRGPGKLRVLVRGLLAGEADAPGAAGAERALGPARRIEADPATPGVLLGPGEEDLALWLPSSPGDLPGLDVAAHLAARPTASGKRLGPVATATVGARRLRVRAALPLDAGPEPWGPRGAPEVDLVAVPRGEDVQVEWLLELD